MKVDPEWATALKKQVHSSLPAITVPISYALYFCVPTIHQLNFQIQKLSANTLVDKKTSAEANRSLLLYFPPSCATKGASVYQ